MRPVFFPEDIATLVAKFPPPTPTKDTPSLVRSKSNPATLVKSNTILQRFGELLKTSTSRIQINNLPTRLDIEATEWLFDCFDGTPILSKDRRSIVPEPEQLAIRDQTIEHVSQNPTTITQLAASYDVAVDSLDLLMERWNLGRKTQQLLVSHGTTFPYIYTSKFELKIESELGELVAEGKKTQRSKIDLPIPQELLLELANAAVQKGVIAGGRFEGFEGDTYYVPDGFEEAARREKAKAYEQQVEKLAEELETSGFCSVPYETDLPSGMGTQSRDALRDGIIAKFQSHEEAGRELVTLTAPGATIRGRLEIWQVGKLNDRVEVARLKAKETIVSWWKSRDDNKSEAAARSSFKDSLFDDQEWATMLSSGGHDNTLDATITELFNEMEQNDTEAFQSLIKTDLQALTTLYLSGIHPITDATLKQHLEEFLFDTLKRDTIPTLLKLLQTNHLLTPKPRARETEKLHSAIQDAKSLQDVHDAITKYTRKLKLEPPSRSELWDVQLSTLRKKVRGMKGTTRGSDLLQNVVWVLLAERKRDEGEGHPALYMSAGRDTSRMIRLYFAVGGDEGLGRKLEGWRDGLKDGKEERALLGEMREVGKEALRRVEGGGGEEKAEAVG